MLTTECCERSVFDADDGDSFPTIPDNFILF